MSAQQPAGLAISRPYDLFEISYKAFSLLPAERPEPRFQWLPFVAVERGGEPPRVPKFRPRERWDGYPADRMRLLAALDWMLTREIDAVNLSLGFHHPFDSREPLAVATRTLAERGIAVVVAAGNRGPEADTLQELARAPWVAAVGATDPRDRLHDTSSRGGDTGPKPLVVADGTPRPDDGRYRSGTSFAAPRVAEAAAFLRVCLHRSLLSLQSFQSGEDSGLLRLRRAVVAYADSGPYPRLEAPAGLLQRWLIDTGCEISLLGDTIRRVLQVVARPLAGYRPSEVGAGIVGQPEVEEFLTRLWPSRWLRVFCPEAASSGTSELAKLDEQLGPLWDPVQVASFSVLYPTVPDWATVATE